MTLTDETALVYEARAIEPAVLRELRVRDDAGVARAAFVDGEGGAPLRCCWRRSAVGERIVLVSYAPLRRWAAEAGVSPGAYDEVGPVFVHAEECGGVEGVRYPAALHGERRVLRAYGGDGRILGGTLVELPVSRAGEVAGIAAGVFADPAVAVVHVRAVEYGCFLLELRRVG